MTRLAALDLGSNSFHLLVAEVGGPHGIERRHTRKVGLRLADPVARDGVLGEARKRAAEAFAELFAEAAAHGAERIVAVATEAIRRASDGKEFCDELARRHGVRVHVLDGLEEAALSVRGMVGALLPDGSEEVLGLDLGGGSFEVGFAAAGGFRAGASLPLGAAQVAAGWGHDPPRLAERAALHQETLARLQPLADQVAGLRAAGRSLRVVGTAGTIREFGRLAVALAGEPVPRKIRGLVVTRDQLEVAYTRLVAVPLEERMRLPGVSEKRADLLPAGGMVVLATLEAFAEERLQLCDWGLREGVLLEALAGDGLIPEADFASTMIP